MKNLFLLFLLSFIAFTKDNDEIKIIGGTDADIENHPWQIALYSNVRGFEQFACGGSIIDEYWIITATHCVYDFQFNQKSNASEFVVKVGIENLETNQSEFLIVDEIFMHQSFDPNNFNYDIALIRLAEPISLGSPNVSSIDLVTPEQFENGLAAPGTIATTSGWGATVPSGFESPTRLQYVELPIIDTDTAFNWFKENPDYDEYDFEANFMDDQITAGFEEGGKSSCFGDSGGPLTIRNEDDTKDILLGLVSWGPKCAAEKTPGVYASVPYYYNWINNIIAGFEPELAFENDAKIYHTENLKITIGCNDEGLLTAKILNNGTNSISSIDYILGITYDDNSTSSYEGSEIFSQPLSSGDRTDVNIQFPFNPIIGDVKIELDVVKTNGVDDPNQRKIELNSTITDQNLLKITYQTQNLTENTSLHIADLEAQSIAASIILDASKDGTEVVEEICVPSGNYVVITHEVVNIQGDMQLRTNHNESGRDLLIFDGQISELLYGQVSFPFIPEFDMGISIESDPLDECEFAETNEVTISLENSSNYFPEDYKVIIKLNGDNQKVITEEEFVDFTNTINLELDELNNLFEFEIDYFLDDVDPSDNKETIYHYNEQKTDYSIATQNEFYNQGALAFFKDGQLVKSISEFNNQTEICLADGCYTLRGTFMGFSETVSDEISITDENGELQAVIKLDNIVELQEFEKEFCLVTNSVSKRNKVEFIDYNKFTQNLKIKLSNASTIVYDLLGNQVLSSSDKNIDVSSLPKGVYSVISVSQNRSFTSTFLIGN